MDKSEPLERERANILFTPARKFALAVTALLYLAGAAAICAYIDDETLQTVLSLPFALVAALLGLSLVNYAVRAWRWALLGDHLGIRVPFSMNVVYFLAGFSLTSTPGKAGEAVRLWFLKSGHGIPYTRSLPLMFADRIIDMWALAILALIAFAGFADYRWQVAFLALLIALVSLPVLLPRRLEPVFAWIRRLAPGRADLLDRGRGIIATMADLRSWRTYGLTLVPTIGGWLAEGVAFYLVLKHFGADLTVLNAVFIFSFSIIVGAISMLPGGLGSTEATLVILLGALGVGLGPALAATAIIRLSTFWFAVVIGVVVTPIAIGAAARSARAPAP